MSITNHVLTGAIIAIAVKQPALALPLAYLSHFVLDALPHFGYPERGFGPALSHKLTYVYGFFNISALLVVLYVLRHRGILPYVAGFAALSPDFLWPYRYFGFERYGKEPPAAGVITRFHQKIQWCERPWGIAAEVVWFGTMFGLLYKVL
ncbi:MAG TPA: hypothetical protein VLE74_02885 [Candidatus Saccharimonadales bacterium]|nr:hypothetical protein [Candidatus Saccharimonadales bacterium]